MKFSLLFTSNEIVWEAVKATANLHCLKLTIHAQHYGITEWSIETGISIADLCNFVGDLGAAVVQATCSHMS